MALTAPVGNSSSRQIAPEGAFPARCYQIVDLGTTMQQGQFPGKKRKVQFIFELPTELTEFAAGEGEKPFYARAIYNLSMNSKSVLRRDIESWVGKKMSDDFAATFDIFTLLGKACMLNITHVTKGDSTYANIIGISPLPKGLACPPQINESLTYNTEDHDEVAFLKLPDFVQDKIKISDEYIARISKPHKATPAPVADAWLGEDDGAPF